MNGTAPVPVAIVFAGSQPVAPRVRERLPADADVIAADSGLRVATALGLHVDHLVGDLDSADPARSRPRSRRARPSSAIRPRRTRPISSSRSTPRSRAARGGSCSSTGAVTGSIICSATCCCSRRRRSPVSQVEAFTGTARIARGARRRSTGHDRRRARQPRHAAAGRRPGARHRHRRAALPAERRRARAGHDTRRQQRARRATRDRCGSQTGTLLVVQPFATTLGVGQ